MRRSGGRQRRGMVAMLARKWRKKRYFTSGNTSPARLAANNRQARYAFRHGVDFPAGIHAGRAADTSMTHRVPCHNARRYNIQRVRFTTRPAIPRPPPARRRGR